MHPFVWLSSSRQYLLYGAGIYDIYFKLYLSILRRGITGAPRLVDMEDIQVL
ncbi:MAG: hypothetical protein LR015_07505 [Verrucomicrobia bacterium]|nr:hypothetical protein [Verrucomicrobiota bacterium]